VASDVVDHGSALHAGTHRGNVMQIAHNGLSPELSNHLL
jgi:hypothetical protein